MTTQEDELKQLIGEKVGEATMCWEPIPSGVFDSTRASAILEEIYQALTKYIEAEVLRGRLDEFKNSVGYFTYGAKKRVKYNEHLSDLEHKLEGK